MTAWLLTIWSFLTPTQPPLAHMAPEGSFRANGELCKDLRWARPHNELPCFDSGKGPEKGVVRSSPFRLPAKLNFFSAGFLSHPGFRIYLVDQTGKRTLDLRQRLDPSLTWREHFWSIPPEWQGATVSLVAEDSATGDQEWMGITAPREGGESLILSLFRGVNRSVLVVILAALFLLPGLAAGLFVSQKFELGLLQLVPAILCGSGTASYLAFWAYFANPAAGKIFSVLVIAGSAGYTIWRRRSIPRLPAIRETTACLALTIIVSVFYSCLGFLYVTDDDPAELSAVRYYYPPGSLPPDNVLPEMLAEKLYNGASPKPTLFVFWHSSDRPPLQAGAVLMVYPVSPVSRPLAYQLLSVFLQCLWLPGLWILVRAAGLSNRYLIPIIAFAIASAFCSLHSFYVWPKLLAAGFMLLAMVPVFRAGWNSIDIVLATVSLSLGLLSHTGIVFTIIPLAMLVVFKRPFPAWRQVAVAVAVGLVFLIPWRLYQTVYDPPGDFLLKFNMTKFQEPEKLPLPFSKLLADSYSGLTPAAYLDIKIADLKALFTGSEFDNLDSGDWTMALGAFSRGSFFHLFWTLGLLNVGFVCRFYTKSTPATRVADKCLWLVSGSAILWIFALFPPGATIIHQWSLANVLLLFLVLVIYIIELRQEMAYALLALQTFVVFPLLIFAKPLVESVAGILYDAPLDPGMLLMALASFSAIVYMGWRAKLQEIV